jgi:uncharacterized membrane protein
MALACVFLYRIMERLVDRESALPAVAAFVCLKPVIFAATDARPYAILLAIFTGSTLALIKWLDSGLRRDAAIYVVTATLIPYYHYLGLLVLGVHALYALARVREGSAVRPRSLLIAAGTAGALMLPILPLLLGVMRQRQLHSLASLLSPTKIFVERYMIGSLTGVAMLTGWAIGRIRPQAARAIIICSIIISSIAAFGRAGRFGRHITNRTGETLWPPCVRRQETRTFRC